MDHLHSIGTVALPPHGRAGGFDHASVHRGADRLFVTRAGVVLRVARATRPNCDPRRRAHGPVTRAIDSSGRRALRLEKQSRPGRVAPTGGGRHDRAHVRRFLAIVIAGAVAATSVAAAAESCPAMRARALKRCCCPPSPQGSARLTCCTVTSTDRATSSARDRPEQAPLASHPVATSWSYPTPPLPLFGGTPAQMLLASAAGPPVVALRI